MMYDSWDMEHDGQNFLSFWTIFFTFIWQAFFNIFMLNLYEVVMWKHCIFNNKNTQKYFRNLEKNIFVTQNSYNKTLLSVHWFFQNTKTWPDCIKVKKLINKASFPVKNLTIYFSIINITASFKYKHNIFCLLLRMTPTHLNLFF